MLWAEVAGKMLVFVSPILLPKHLVGFFILVRIRILRAEDSDCLVFPLGSRIARRYWGCYSGETEASESERYGSPPP